MFLRLLVFFSALTSLTVSCLEIQGAIQWNSVCRDASELGPAKAVLDHGIYHGSVAKDGQFTIPNVPRGTFILSVQSHDFVFDQLRVDVGNASVVVRPYLPGTPLDPPSSVQLPHPIVLSAKQRYNYFVPQEHFSVASMLKNPMMILMIVAGGMVLAMPYLMKNIDPEALEEFKEQQAKIAGVQNAMASGNLRAGFSTLMDAAEEAAQSGKKAPQTPKNKGGKKRQ
ncbi:hypothetical protein AX16_005662 [Volvariella volvacea WC 439]|nr:hypothetical protein AX16_005662 [Volvariella volvacea WC 439]